MQKPGFLDKNSLKFRFSLSEKWDFGQNWNNGSITEALVRETHKLVVEQLAKKKSELERYKEIKEAMATNAFKN